MDCTLRFFATHVLVEFMELIYTTILCRALQEFFLGGGRSKSTTYTVRHGSTSKPPNRGVPIQLEYFLIGFVEITWVILVWFRWVQSLGPPAALVSYASHHACG